MNIQYNWTKPTGIYQLLQKSIWIVGRYERTIPSRQQTEEVWIEGGIGQL